MSFILRCLVIMATAGSLTVPSQVASDATGSSGRRRAANPPATSEPAATPKFIESNLEYYLTEDGIAYIRPGLKIKVNSITIGTDRKITLDLNFTDNFDQPLDRLGKVTPGVISPSFIIAWWNPATRAYTSYITRTATPAATSPRAGQPAVQQATSESNGRWTDLELGHSRYVFNNALPANFDQTKTHTLGVQAVRNLTDIIGKNYIFNTEIDFRPDGQKVTDTWAKITDATSCLNCHDSQTFGFHGSSARRDVKLCVLCHNPQTIDPDTGNSVDLKVMAHKIHAGAQLPSVIAGTPYTIWGNANSVHDYSNIHYPQDLRNCDNCHEGTVPASAPAQKDVWYTFPSRAACGSCHDTVDFATGKNHGDGRIPPQTDDSQCVKCHIPDSGHEFDASIVGAHTIPAKSDQLKGLKVTIASVTNVGAGKKPTVAFKITNGDGTAVDGTKLATFAPILAGPTTSYTTYFRESGVASSTNTNPGVFDATTGTTTYTFTRAIPADATGTYAISADVYRNATLKRNDGGADISQREAAMNPIKYIAVTDKAPVARRTVVTMAQCNKCHDALALHGGQRQAIEECVICHNPVSDDQSRRPAAAGKPESISFQYMIHRIHTGAELTKDYTVYGFGNTAINFNGIHYPGDRRNCAGCHVGNSHRLPSDGDAVITQRDFFSPMGPGTAACLGCHDSKDAAAHAYLNTTTFAGKPAEACGACHGANSEWSADKVHAR